MSQMETRGCLKRKLTTSSDERISSINDVLEKSSQPLKRQRRSKAVTLEERQRRAEERKIKNREAAQRSRQRVLQELKRDKERLTALESEMQTLRNENAELKAQLKMFMEGRFVKRERMMDTDFKIDETLFGFEAGSYDETARFGSRLRSRPFSQGFLSL